MKGQTRIHFPFFAEIAKIFFLFLRQSCTLYAEFLPTAVRGRAIMVMSFFWAFGACLEALLAWAIMPTLGWRYLVQDNYLLRDAYTKNSSVRFLQSCGDRCFAR
jgi:hypothetical protein